MGEIKEECLVEKVDVVLEKKIMHNGLQFHPSHCNWFKWILNGWVIFHDVYVPQLPYPFICWWRSRLLPCPGYYKQCCDRSPAQVGCMRQVLRPGALGRPRGIRWRGRWEGGSGWGIHVTPWLIHVNVWQNSLQYCKVISLQLIKINEKKSHAGQQAEVMGTKGKDMRWG